MCTEGPLLILAGAGSGKTRVLVSRIQHLVSSQNPAPGICALTFTNKAAKELKHRVQLQLGRKTKSLWAGTFHSFGLQLLRKYPKKAGLSRSFSIIDSGDAQAVVKDLLMTTTNIAKQDLQVDALLEHMGTLRGGDRLGVDVDPEYAAVAQVLAPKYEQRLRRLGVVDFEDLLLKPLRLFEEHPDICEKVQNLYPYLMVDEFQDTNTVQMKLIQKLTEKQQNIAVVGDDDQAIYGWRGAEVKNILDFPKKFEGCQVIQLEQNYRSGKEILDLANAVIKNNKDRHGKVLKAQPTSDSGAKPEVFVFEDDEEEVQRLAQMIAETQQRGYRFSDIAILYRSNGQGSFLETELRACQIPYKISGGSGLFDRREVKDVVAYLQCLSRPKEVHLRRILNVPSRGIGDETFFQIEAFGEAQGITFSKACSRGGRLESLPQSGRKGIALFYEQIESLRAALFGNSNVEYDHALLHFLREIGYRKYLGKYCKNDEALNKRWASLEVVARVFANFINRSEDRQEGLQKFLDLMVLRECETDTADQEDAVQLLTLHAAKGLEYPVVFLIGIEEDILPHRRLGGDTDEERRLFYVGITRAEKELVLTYARQRKRFGRMQDVSPSRFLLEVDEELYSKYEAGYRPLAADTKEQLLSELKAKLNASMVSQNLD